MQMPGSRIWKSFKWNMGWMHNFCEYMKLDPYFRKDNHYAMTFAMSYNESEHYILPLSHDEVVHLKCSMVEKMPGYKVDKYANLRLGYTYMLGHSGKKLLFMGQEFATFDEWNEKESLDWDLLQYQDHSDMRGFVKALNSLIKAHPALYADDCRPEGFQWINNISANENMLVFLRKAEGETLLVVCNFSPLVYEKHKIGVPFEGKYKEIFNSDSEEFGGSDVRNKRVKTSKKSECDGFENSIEITVPPMGVAVFACTEEKLPAKEKKMAAKKPAAKKAEPKKSSAKKEAVKGAVKPEAKKPSKKKGAAKKAEKPAAKTTSGKGRTEKA